MSKAKEKLEEINNEREEKLNNIIVPAEMKELSKRELADQEYMLALREKCKQAFGEPKNSPVYKAIDDHIYEKWEKNADGENAGQAYEVVDALYETTNDLGNAHRFVHRHTDKVKYIVEEMDWVYWNGDRWTRDAKRTKIRKMFQEAVADFDTAVKETKKFVKGEVKSLDKSVQIKLSQLEAWVRSSKNSRTINSGLEALGSLEGVAESILEFDKKGHFFGVQNGVLDLRTGKLINNDPSYLMLKSAPVAFDPKAQCPRFEQFLREVFEDDEGKIDTIKQVLGSAMVGVTKDKFFIFHGGGSNGKTTLVSIMNKVLGTADGDGYSITTSPRVFMDGQQNNTEYYMARLKGARLLYMSETEAVATLKDDLVKQVTPDNDEQVTARKVRGEVFEYSVVATPILLTNNKPKVKDMSDGMWRRLVLINFNKHFTEAEKDRNLMAVLESEKTGILNWCLEGAQQYMKNGRQIELSDSIKHDIEMWKTNEDAVKTFWDEKFIEFNGRNVSLKDIKAVWDKHVEEMGGGKYTAQWLRRTLESRGVRFEAYGNGGLPHAMGWAIIDELTGKDKQSLKENLGDNISHLVSVFPKL